MTRTTARVLAALAVTGALAASTGCGTGTPPPRLTPTPTRSAAATPSGAHSVSPSVSPIAPSPTPPPTDSGSIFAADGVGPYLIGAQLADLQAHALVIGAADSTTCGGTVTAVAVGRYASVLSLSFVGGRLVSIRTTSDSLVTPSGVKVGTALADAQTLYGGRGTIITSPSGGKAMVLRVTGTALALVLYVDANAVTAMSGGEADRLETAARLGEAC